MNLKLAINIFCVFLIMGCESKDDSILQAPIDTKKEIATDIELFYSDSAITQFRIVSPRRESYLEEEKLIENYPEGLDIEFYNKDGSILSSMVASSASRINVEGLMILKDSVVMVNASGDELYTSGIIWNELESTLRTEKFIRLIKASSKDTFYGFGFEAIDDFSQFSIKQLSGKRRYEDLTAQ